MVEVIHLFHVLSVLFVFLMFSKTTPYSPIWDYMIQQFVGPWSIADSLWRTPTQTYKHICVCTPPSLHALTLWYYCLNLALSEAPPES